MIERYAQWLQNHRAFVYFLCVLLTCITSAGMLQLTFKADYRIFFTSDDLGYAEFQAMEQRFPSSDDLVYVLSPQEGELFSRDMVEALDWLAAELRALPFVTKVDSLLDYPFYLVDKDELYIGYLTDVLADEPATHSLPEYYEKALGDPMILGTLFGTKGNSVAVVATYELPGRNDLTEYPAAMRQVKQLRRRLEAKYPGYDVAVSGVLVYNHAIITHAVSDLMQLLPITALLIAVILLLFLRSWRGALFTLIVIGFTLACALGLWGWLGMPLNSASISAPIAILALAVADCVHLADSYLLSARENPSGNHRAHITRSLVLNGKPIFLTSLTSVLGFLSMNLCESPPYRDLGNLVAIGIGFAWIFSMALYPALVGQFGLRQSNIQQWLYGWLKRLADFICRRYRGVLVGYGVLIVAALACVSLNKLDDNVVEWFDVDNQMRRDAEYINRHHTGMFQLYYVLESENPGGALEPEFLEEVQAFTRWLRTQPEVVQARSLADLVAASYSASIRVDEPTLPASRLMVSQILDTIGILADRERPLQAFISEDRQALRLHVSVRTMPSSAFIAFEERVDFWLRANLPELQTGGGVSPSMMFARLSQHVVPTMLSTTGVMIAMISLLLILMIRSLPLGLLSLVPNLIPIGIAFGLWGILSGHVGIALSIVAGASLGIVVDDTIHLLAKYQRARLDLNQSPPEAVRHAITHVGGALTVTTLILAAGFFVLGFSSLQPNAEIGNMVGIIIITALVTDLLFLPALMLWIESRKPMFNKEN